MTMLASSRERYTLIVVDMQAKFSSSLKRSTMRECKTLVSRAIFDDQPIILLEYVGFGTTLPSIYNMIDGYDQVFIGRKNDDGSHEVSGIINGFSLPKNNFKVCGVNTDACVLRTVRGLRKRFKTADIEVYEKACNTNYSHEHGMKLIKDIKNVQVVI